VFTIIEAPTYGWTAARSVAGFAAAAVLLAAFIAAERRAARPAAGEAEAAEGAPETETQAHPAAPGRQPAAATEGSSWA